AQAAANKRPVTSYAAGVGGGALVCARWDVTSASRSTCSRHRNWPGRHQLFPRQIDAEVHAFEPQCAEQHHVVLLGKHDDRWRRTPTGVENGPADLACKRASVGRLEVLAAFRADAELLERRARS